MEELRLYLLGRLESEHRAELVEERMLTDGEYYEQLLVEEDELISRYLSGGLRAEEREAFEHYFLSTPERVRKLKFARAFNRYVSAAGAESAPAPRRRWNFLHVALARPARLALAAAVILCCVALAWWAYTGPSRRVGRGLAALEAAYRDRRPVESRISGFGYAPWTVTRGDSRPQFDATSRDQAERVLLDAAREDAGPAAKHALGKLYLAEQKYDQAIAAFREALKDDEGNARLHSDLGAAIFEKERSARAGDEKDIEALARSVEHFNRAVELDDSLLEAYFNRALAYEQMMLPRQALESWREYLSRDADSPWAEEAGRRLRRLEESGGQTSQNPNQTLQEFMDAHRAGDDEAAWKVVSGHYTSAGNEVTNRLLDSLLGLEPSAPTDAHASALPALSHLARLEAARAGDRFTTDLVKHYERAPPSSRPALADARRHLSAGYELFTQSKFSEAVNEYDAAKLAFERADSQPGKIFTEYRLAHCYVFLAELDKARLAFERLHDECEAREYRWLVAHSLYGLAHVSAADGNEYSQAEDYSRRALAAFERADDRNGILRCLTQLADFNQSLNRPERSFGYLRRGLALSGESRAEPMQRWGILVQTAFSLSSMRLHTAALFYQKEALSVALQMGRPLIISRSYGYVGTAYAALKSYAEALGSVRRAFETGEGVADAAGGLEIMANASQQLGDIFRQSGECDRAVEAYDRSIELYGRLNFDYYSYAAHKGKLLCFMAGPDDRLAGEELRTVLALFEQYRTKVTAQSQRDSFFDVEQSVYDLAIAYESSRVKNPARAFEYSEESRARSLLDARLRGAEVLKKSYGPDVHLPAVARPMSLGELQAALPEGAQVLQYAVLDDRLLVWVVTRSDIRMEETAVGAELLAEQVRAYLAAVREAPSAGGGGEHARLAADLYKLLVSPVEPFLDRSKFLCVVPDKILHYLPYEALVSPATGRYLLEDYDLGVAPSSNIFVDLTASAERKMGPSEEKLLSVGDPRFSRSTFPELPGLPSAAREAEAVSAFYRTRRVLLRGEAGEQSFRSEIEKADVAHLALHYVVNADSEMLSGFPLAAEPAPAAGREDADGFLQSYELYTLKLPRTRLVVLSACQTGIEQHYGGEGAASVARPFLAAGVPLVVASLWPIDSDASAELMTSFHRHRVRDRLTATQALRRAQIEMARGDDVRYRHPFYWAPFVAVGGHTRF